ncbi:uncharacterized protein LOC120112543 [Phoenix dactylifera]|uniref:Uncharacterized protein LOC120112543 n=1 Tax=Phoenix dactylifera TaxID=42345 RepID=A0A8B9AR80_PHODC|nr:uncharacterized protein LOC120112543 [Phoenix dactylifera]
MAIVPQAATMKGGGGVSFSYPQLTATNYTTWAIKVEALMQAQDAWEAVEEADGADVDARKDKTARALLLQTLPEDILLQVAKKKTAKEVWGSLKTRFVGADRVKTARLQTLKNDFDVMQMKEGETLDDYASRLSGMSVRYASLGEMLDDATLVRKLLNTVPDRYYQVIAGIEQFCDLDTMPFEEAVGRLTAYGERARLRNPSGSNDGQLLLTQAEWQTRQDRVGRDSFSSNRGKSCVPAEGGNRSRGGRGRGRGRGRGLRSGSPRKDGSGGPGGSRRDKSHIKCFNCQKMGHYASECRSKPCNEEVNLSFMEEEKPALLLSASVETRDLVLLNEETVEPQLRAGSEDVSSTWYFDNGASNHMSGEKKSSTSWTSQSRGT